MNILLLEFFYSDPWWIGGTAIILLLSLGLLLFSWWRNVKILTWFYGAAVVLGALYAGVLQCYPMVLQSLVSYRSDWSLLYLLEHPSAMSLLSQLVLYVLLYAAMGVLMLLVLGVWCLVTVRLQRFRVLLERALDLSWLVVFFAVLSVLMNQLISLVYPLDFTALEQLFAIGAFLFGLQFFLRLIDTAYLNTPSLFLEYVYATGLSWFVISTVVEVFLQLTQEAFVAQDFFLMQVFSFFLVVLILGYLATFLLRSQFCSVFFLRHYEDRSGRVLYWSTRVFLSFPEGGYQGQRLILGVTLAMAVGSGFLALALMGWHLVLIPLFFLGYFLLFFLLDRQDDMRVKGDLVEER